MPLQPFVAHDNPEDCGGEQSRDHHNICEAKKKTHESQSPSRLAIVLP